MENKILKYCKELSKINTTHIEEAKENLSYLKNGEFSLLNGCPTSFGADENFVGFCEEVKVEDSEQFKQCEECWKTAFKIS